MTSAAMKGSGLAALLRQTVLTGDVNACCGVLRRVFSESVHREEATLAMSVMRHRRLGPPTTTAANVGTHHPSSSLQSSASLVSSTQSDVVSFACLARAQRGQAGSLASVTAQAVLRSPFPQPNAAPLPPSPSSSSPPIQTKEPESLVERIFDLAKASLSGNASLVKASSLQVLCHTAQRTGHWAEALHFSDFLPRAPAALFLSSLLQPDNVQAVLQHCVLRGWALDVPNAIRVLAEERGSWVEALAVAQDAERRFPSGEVYTLGVLVPYLAASGATEQARQLFESGLAHGSLVDPALIQHLLLRTAALKQWETCLHMLACLHRTQEVAQLLPNDADFFRQLMEQSPGWKASLRIFDAARALDVRPDEGTMAILLTQCDRAGAWRVAAEVYETAVRENFVDRLAAGLTYHTLVRAFAAMQQWQKALEALSWMSKAGDASMSAGMGELVTACEQAGQWEAALAIGATLMESGAHLVSAETSMSLLFACAKGAKWSLATHLFHATLHDVRVDPHPLALCAAMQACVAAQEWSAALSLYQEAQAAQPRTVVPPLAHRMAVKACVAGGQWGKAITMLETMQKDGLPLDNHSQRLGLYAAALQGQWALSLTFLQAIPRRARTPQDRMVVRNATRAVSPAVDALALRLLQSS